MRREDAADAIGVMRIGTFDQSIVGISSECSRATADPSVLR
jgi:hypothetical protein